MVLVTPFVTYALYIIVILSRSIVMYRGYLEVVFVSQSNFLLNVEQSSNKKQELKMTIYVSNVT